MESKAAAAPCGWSVCWHDEWLRSSYQAMPSEHAMLLSHVADACVMSGHLPAGEMEGIYECELHAVTRALLSDKEPGVSPPALAVSRA